MKPSLERAVVALVSAGLGASLIRLRRGERAVAGCDDQAPGSGDGERRLAASLSHELRTPLNSVIGFSELMLDGRSGPLSETQSEQIGIIRASAEHMLALVTDMLDEARLHAGHIPLQPQPIEPAAVVGECVGSLRQIAAQRGVKIEFDGAPIGTARLDPTRLRQVVLNYLGNAIKFVAEHGVVSVRIERTRGSLILEVTDTGPGLAPEHAARVFDPFPVLPVPRRDGTGLGLAITKLIVEAHGGEVGVRSAPGSGSTFYARLPVAGAQLTDPPLALVATGEQRRAPTSPPPLTMAGRR
jgi:signal transduction histidine kinase